MTANTEMTVVDQYTDRSGAALVKIANRLKDRGLAKLALDTLFAMDRTPSSEAVFPTDTPKDTFLSRIYFEGQREKIAAAKAEAIDRQLGLYEVLHDLTTPRITFREPEAVKTASTQYELLPMCKIASSDELIQAGNDFSRDFLQLSGKDRFTFAANFVKAAGELGVEPPETVRLFVTGHAVVNPKVAEHVLHRKVAMERAGEYDSGYGALYEGLLQLDLKNTDVSELTKLAEALEFADRTYSLSSRKSAKGIPDAWHSVFQVKKAEEDEGNGTPEASNLKHDKAALISRFGMGVLEEVEDEEGNLDTERVEQLLARMGIKADDTRTDNATNSGVQ